MEDLGFWKNKKVFITGHTGFKGSWLCRMLIHAGAEVTGYALGPASGPNLFDLSGVEPYIHSVIGDVRDIERLEKSFEEACPEIVIHLAAQPIVMEGYRSPRATYETNVMGTVNVLECVRNAKTVRSVVNVTTDKVYQNNEWPWGYRENEPLDGFDPYSNSKSCAELVTHCYKNSFFNETNVAVSTARAGNVLGGGDFADSRIIPDCVRAVQKQQPVILRNPHSTRPYQHVLDPLWAYLLIAQAQYEDLTVADYYNVGPDDCNCVTTGALAEMFCKSYGPPACCEIQPYQGPHEAHFLKLDCSKLKAVLNWKSRWGIEKTVDQTVEWTRLYLNGGDIPGCMDRQIRAFVMENKNDVF